MCAATLTNLQDLQHFSVNVLFQEHLGAATGIRTRDLILRLHRFFMYTSGLDCILSLFTFRINVASLVSRSGLPLSGLPRSCPFA